MNFFKALFGGSEETPEQKQQADEARKFDMFKYDGVRAAKIGQHAYAVKCFNEALKLRDDLEVRDYLSQALVRTGELAEAYEQLQKLAEAEPENMAVWLRTAQVAHMMENYTAMAQACERALLIDNSDARAHYLYAQACIGQDDVVNAIAMLTKAIALQADMADAYLLRGQTLLKMGDTAGAAEDCGHLLAEHADNEDVLLLSAAKGEADKAIEAYGKVIDANPFCADAYKERGAVKYEKGDMKGAQEDAQRAMELQPEGMENVSGDYSAEGIEQKTRQAYSNLNPFGV